MSPETMMGLGLAGMFVIICGVAALAVLRQWRWARRTQVFEYDNWKDVPEKHKRVFRRTMKNMRQSMNHMFDGFDDWFSKDPKEDEDVTDET